MQCATYAETNILPGVDYNADDKVFHHHKYTAVWKNTTGLFNCLVSLQIWGQRPFPSDNPQILASPSNLS